ncbi:MAG: c-type cytochrome [Woeseia sp.]
MKTFSYPYAVAALSALVLAIFAHPAAAQGDAAEGRQLGFTCIGCHGIPSYRNAYPSYRVPKLGGQKSAYLTAALRAYRDGTRPHPTMQAQGGSLSDQDIHDLVAWIGETSEARDELDAQTAGLPDAARTCVTCHSTAGAEMEPVPPVLSGQHQDYLEHALSQYKNNARGVNVMTSFAAGLTPADMRALAQFYASRDGLVTLREKE